MSVAPFPERFWLKVEKQQTGCWLWTGHRDRDGYGKVTLDGMSRLAHRVAYELTYGPIPKGMQLDHVKARGCTSRACVNPGHLEPVTNRVNSMRGESFAAVNARRTHCIHGHEFTPENTRTYHYPTQTQRICRTCEVIRQKTYQQRRKETA